MPTTTNFTGTVRLRLTGLRGRTAHCLSLGGRLISKLRTGKVSFTIGNHLGRKVTPRIVDI